MNTATIRVNSPWFDVIEIDLADGNYPDTKLSERYHDLEKELYELKSILTGVTELPPQQQIQQVFSQILNATGVTAGTTAGTAAFSVNNPGVAVNASWRCSCGAVNTGNFCPNCGGKKPFVPTVIRCDKCGWQTQDVNNPPRFCPNCGDPINGADVM